MQKKNLIFIFILVLAAGLVFSPKLFSKNAPLGVSEYKTYAETQTSDYLDKRVTITGVVSEVYNDENLIVLADPAGCCVIPFQAPFTEQQQVDGIGHLYKGTLPRQGDTLEATGTLRRFDQGLYFELHTLKRNGDVIISQVK
jgi:hypothetical protein